MFFINLIYFLLGVITINLIMPIIEGLVELFLSFIEAKKIKYGEEINNANIRIQMANLEAEERQIPVSTNVIGFQVPSEEEYYDEEDEDFESEV